MSEHAKKQQRKAINFFRSTREQRKGCLRKSGISLFDYGIEEFRN
jgi:hypothetical protein